MQSSESGSLSRTSGGNYLLSTDGSGTGPVSNPSPGAIGVVLRNPRGAVIATISRAIGPATNTMAEYTALIEGLQLARNRGVDRVRVFVDSELLVDQLQDRAAVKADHLRGLVEHARSLLSEFGNHRLSWVPRAWNSEADLLATAALRTNNEMTSVTSTETPDPREGAAVVDQEGQAIWISEHTDLPLVAVERVLALELEFMIAAGIVNVSSHEFLYYSPDEVEDTRGVVDTQRIAQDAERLLNVPVEVAAQILDAEYQFLRMRGIAD